MILLFDIAFKFGEFYNEDGSWWLSLINSIIGAGIGSGATLWALYQTFKRDKIKDNDRRLQFQREKIQYLQSLVRTIIMDLKLQIENYKKISDMIRLNPVDLYPPD